MRSWWWVGVVVGVVGSAGCGEHDDAKQAARETADQAASAAGSAAGQAASAAGSAAEQVASAARSAADGVGERFHAELAELGAKAAERVDAELKAWLAGLDGDALLGRVLGASSSASALAKVAKPLAGAVRSDTTVLPIVRPVGASTADVDAAIGDMPRTQVIDGVTVGFRQLNLVDNHRRLSERGYLVLWRRGDWLLGFVYRSENEVDIETLIKQTPALMKVVSEAASGP